MADMSQIHIGSLVKIATSRPRFGTLLAAMKIYDASEPTFRINPCRFFDSNEDAMEDMKRLAAK